MKPQLVILLVLSGVAAVFIAMDWIGLWMERRGWIYWRKRKREGGGAMGSVLTGFQQIVEPRIEHRIQVMEERNESIGQRLGGRRDNDDDDNDDDDDDDDDDDQHDDDTNDPHAAKNSKTST